MAFFNVSGGPWGSEDIFSTAGPLVGSISILFFTFFFCVPQILMTSELSCALPSNGGYSIWVREAFGDFSAFQLTYWQWVSGVADAAVYPTLICDSVMQALGNRDAPISEVWMWRALTTLVLTLPTFVSIQSVPSMLVGMAAITGVPVMTFVVAGLTTDGETGAIAAAVSATPAAAAVPMCLGSMVNVLYWNMEGWDCISTCSALIKEPLEKNIPRGLFIALAITSTMYLSVLLVASGINQDVFPWRSWSDGTLPSIGCSLGVLMCGLLLGSSVVGNAGQYLSEFLEDSYLLQGAAEMGIVPSFFGRTLPSGAPWIANAVQLLIILVVVSFDFSDILVFDNFFCAIALLMEFAAFFQLRRTQPDMPRPYKVSSWAFPLFPVAIAIICVVIWHCTTKSWKGAAINLLALVAGLPYGVWVARSSRQEHDRGLRSSLDCLLEDA